MDMNWEPVMRIAIIFVTTLLILLMLFSLWKWVL
jgi:hypothetical protein